MDATASRLPTLGQHLGGLGAGLVEPHPAGSPSPTRQAELLATLGLAQAERSALARGHAVAVRQNPALRGPLDPHLAATEAAVDEIGIMVNDAGLGADRPAAARLGARDVFDRYTRALSAIWSHHDAAAMALDRVLAARIRMLVTRRTMLLAVVAIAMALVAYLWVSFYVAVKRAVGALDDVSKRMRTGEFGGPVAVDTRDELRQVVESFNTVASRLRTEWARAQEESARARAAEASLTVARDAAEAATRAKSEFLAVMSHEIRTPMNGILGMTHLLLGTRLDPEQRRFAEAVRDSGQALLIILNDVLDFSKMEAGKLELSTADFDLPSVVSSVIALMASAAREKELALETQGRRPTSRARFAAMPGGCDRSCSTLSATPSSSRRRAWCASRWSGWPRRVTGPPSASRSAIPGSGSRSRNRAGSSRSSPRWGSRVGGDSAAPASGWRSRGGS